MHLDVRYFNRLNQLNFYAYKKHFTHIKRVGQARLNMRTNIEIDDKLMSDVLKATGLKTKRDVVELGLKTLIRLEKQKNIRNFRGKLTWTGDLNDMRCAS